MVFPPEIRADLQKFAHNSAPAENAFRQQPFGRDLGFYWNA